jgi:ATPase subunit of ABC transporter with duplicated ATPase domains
VAGREWSGQWCRQDDAAQASYWRLYTEGRSYRASRGGGILRAANGRSSSGLQGLLDADDGSAWELKGRLGLEWDWFQRWQTLSHGERKRDQIASALWLEPQVLAVDEPTNHIDVDARQMLVGALRAYRGIGLLVSHDRELLDGLCRQCVFVDPPNAELRPGGYSQGNEQGLRQDEETRHLVVQVKKEHERLHRETIRRRDEATRSDRRVSTRGLDKEQCRTRQTQFGARNGPGCRQWQAIASVRRAFAAERGQSGPDAGKKAVRTRHLDAGWAL